METAALLALIGVPGAVNATIQISRDVHERLSHQLPDEELLTEYKSLQVRWETVYHLYSQNLGNESLTRLKAKINDFVATNQDVTKRVDFVRNLGLHHYKPIHEKKREHIKFLRAELSKFRKDLTLISSCVYSHLYFKRITSNEAS